jgi:anti-anti-sigma regulatory factor/putative methionine-R-sulfoxide reductase with GAF domain
MDVNHVNLELISFLSNAAGALAAARDLPTLTEVLHELLDRVARVEYSAFYLVDPATGALRLLTAKGFTEAELLEAERTAMDRHPGWVLRNKAVLHVPDLAADEEHRTRETPRRFQVRARVYVPVLVGAECVGALGLAASKPHAFSEAQIETLGFFARLAGVVYRNIRHLGQLDQQLTMIRAQREQILSQSAPILDLDVGLLLVPIVGQLDEGRALRLTERLLGEVVRQRARAVVLDLTGLEAMDAGIAAQVSRIIGALSLLGSRCVVCGLQPELAVASVDVLSELPGLCTVGTLREALGLVRVKRRRA